MSLQTWLKSEVEYGEELARSAFEGARTARDEALASESASEVLRRLARTAWTSAAVGASLGVLLALSASKRSAKRNAAVFGLLGAALGFGGHIAFCTRHVTEQTVRGAVKNMNTVRDAHWLARNPIDYA